MGYYGYRRRRYRYSGWGGSNPSRRSEVSRLYGGIDDDVRKMFFALDAFTLKCVFNRYQRDHGEGKRKYAETTFAKWRSRDVEMSGEISERLVRIVPSFLTFDQKYELIEKLWNKLRQKTTLNVTISPHGGLAAAIEAVMGAIDAIGQQEIPPAVAQRLEWLAADDAVAAQALLGEVGKREGQIAVQTLETELRQLLTIVHEHQDKIVAGTRAVTLPGATVYIHVSQAASPVIRKPAMSNGQTPPDKNQSWQLAPKQGDQPRELAPIQNPNDLLNEALRRMTPQKQEQIIGKAGDEALRLQVKQKEGVVDHEMAASKIDQVVEGARRAAGAGEFNVEGEHRSEHGYIKVNVRNKKPSLSEKVGGCFVATACFGDYSHPAVIALREFRDNCLQCSAAGRGFVEWYYRTSPRYAKRIENNAALRFAGRLFLWPLVVSARIATWLRRSP